MSSINHYLRSIKRLNPIEYCWAISSTAQMLIEYGKLLHDRALFIGVDWVAMEDIHPWYLECWKKGIVGVGKTIRPRVQRKRLIDEGIGIAKALLDDGGKEGGEVKGVGRWPANWR